MLLILRPFVLTSMRFAWQLQQYWADTSRPYEFVPVKVLSEAYEKSARGRANLDDLNSPQPSSGGGTPPKQPLDPLVRNRQGSSSRVKTP